MPDDLKNPFDLFSSALADSVDLALFSRFLTFEAGETIISVDEPGDNVYFILSGAVKITNYSLKGKEIWHGTLGSGRTFGELAALTGETRSASIVALETTRLAVLTKTELDTLMRQDVEIAMWLLKDLAARLAQSTETVQSLLSRSVAERIRRELYRLALAGGERNEAGEMILRPVPNLSELARRLNTDRELVSREVSACVKRHMLIKDRKQMVLLDPAYFASEDG